MSHSGIDHDIAAGPYATMAGFTHPSIVFAQEHRSVSPEGSVVHDYRIGDLYKVVRLAILIFADGLLRWIGYYMNNDQERLDQLIHVAGRLDSMPPISFDRI